MNKELKGKLEKALLDAGLDKGLLSFVNIEKEDEIQGVVDNLNKLKTPKLSIEDQLKQKEIQSEIDRRISEAKKKWEEGKQDPPTPPNPTNGITAESIAAIVAEAQKPLLEKLNGFEANKTREEKISQARKALESSKIPEKNRSFYLDLYNPDSETNIEDWVKNSEEKHENYAQSLQDDTKLSAAPPAFIKNGEMTEAEAQRIAESVAM